MIAHALRRTSIILNLLAILVLTMNGAVSAQSPSSDASAQAATSISNTNVRSSPVMFIENAGQWDKRARFQVWGGSAGTMWLAEDAMWITVAEPPADNVVHSRVEPLARFDPEREDVQRDDVPSKAVNIKLSFVGANPHPTLEPFDRLDTVVSYFIGSEPDQWRPDVPVWGGVRYVDLYPGVDLEITSESGQMVLRLAAQHRANLAAVRLRVEGADAVAVGGDALRLSTAVGEIAWPLFQAGGMQDAEPWVQPLSAQEFDVDTPFASPNADSAARDASSPQSVTNNPADLLYGTFLGRNYDEAGSGIAVDNGGAAYVTGGTWSADFPTTPGAFDRSHGGDLDAFVVKLHPAGSALVYATFLGGSSVEVGGRIAVDESAAAYVTGSTRSADFPTTAGAFDRSHGGGNCGTSTAPQLCNDAFAIKLNPAGSALHYATFLGGNDVDDGMSIAIDGGGATYVAGNTRSADFPTTAGAFDRSHGGGNCGTSTAPKLCEDAFVVKLNPAGSALAYATFLGGSSVDYGYSIAADGSGAVSLTGVTTSANFPTTSGAFDRSLGGYVDVFVAKLNPAGSALHYATFLGGSDVELGLGIAVDSDDAAYVTGYTSSADFPITPGAFDHSLADYTDAFVVKLNPAGSALHYATFLGGGSLDEGYSIAVDESGVAYVTGLTWSADFPTTPGAFDRSYGGGTCSSLPCDDAFVVQLNPAGSALAYATFLGGSSVDYGYSIAMDGSGAVYVTGVTGSANFPTTSGAFDQSFNGGGDAFVVKLAMGGAYAPTPDGYSFQNRAAHTSWEIFRDTFGAENVEWTIGGVTVARPEAARYYHNHYKCDNPLPALAGWCTETGAGGNCSGMATSSMLLFKGWADPADFLSQQNVTRVVDLPAPSLSGDFWRSSVVADFIVRYQGYQEGRQVKAARVAAGNQSVSEALASLKTAIDGGLADPQVISIWGPYDSAAADPNHSNAQCGGHDLIPYAYQQDGVATRVYVYDSNHDKNSSTRSSQFVLFTPSTNTWSYAHNNSIGVWRSGQTCKSQAMTSQADLMVTPLSAWKDHPTPPWDWKGSPTASALLESGWYELAVSPNASLQAIDSLGRVVGNRNGTLALEIPGSALWIPTDVTPGITPSHTEQYVITSSSRLTLKMSYEESGTAALSALVPEGIVAVTGASTVAGMTDTVYISPDARQISVQAGSSGGGRAVTTTRDEDTYGREITIDDFLLTPGASAEVLARADGGVSFASSVMQPSYGIKLRQAGAVSSMYVADGPSMMADDVHVIRLNWSNPTTATIEIDHGGDGTVDETRVLQNQIKKVYLPLVFRK